MATELPLPEFDELPVNTLKHRIRSLTRQELVTLREHERAHANRVPVLEVLDRRIEELDQGATPTPGPEEQPSDVPAHSASPSPAEPRGPRGKGRPTEHGTSSSTGKGMEHTE